AADVADDGADDLPVREPATEVFEVPPLELKTTEPVADTLPLDRGAGHPEMQEPPPISIVERSRSAVWPLMAALVIGLAIGFATGYGAGTHERTTTLTTAAVAPPSMTPPATGRESTDVALAAPPVAPPVAPPAAARVAPPSKDIAPSRTPARQERQ